MAAMVLGVVFSLFVVAVATYLYFDRGLPSVSALRTYQPPQVTKVTCADGTLCAEFYRERRTLVPLASLPSHIKNAFLAAEDADFYRHEGLDYSGMIRAAAKSLFLGSRPTGASTITQQACRNLLLSQERTLSRKIKEWILAPRMEKALTKDQILNLYLNQIYFGHNRYGIEEAALYYFGKHAKDLSIGEAATLAGVPQLPHRINPVTNIVKAKNRQRYVLHQMAKHGFLRCHRGRTTPMKSARLWSPVTGRSRCSPGECASRWRCNLGCRWPPTRRFARGWRSWIAAWATAVRWERSKPPVSTYSKR